MNHVCACSGGIYLSTRNSYFTAAQRQRRSTDDWGYRGQGKDALASIHAFFIFLSMCVKLSPLSLGKAAAPRPLPPPPTLSVDLESRKRSTENRNTVAATTSSSVSSCNDEFLPQKVVRKLPAPQCNQKGMRLCHL